MIVPVAVHLDVDNTGEEHSQYKIERMQNMFFVVGSSVLFVFGVSFWRQEGGQWCVCLFCACMCVGMCACWGGVPLSSAYSARGHGRDKNAPGDSWGFMGRLHRGDERPALRLKASSLHNSPCCYFHVHIVNPLVKPLHSFKTTLKKKF